LTYQDKTLTCRDCGREFAFTASEPEFVAQKRCVKEPGSCPECRLARNAWSKVEPNLAATAEPSADG
jgi:hypothetical protein